MALIAWFPLNEREIKNQGTLSLSFLRDEGLYWNYTRSHYRDDMCSTFGKVTQYCAQSQSLREGLWSNEKFELEANSPISIFTWVKMYTFDTTGSLLNGLVSNHSHNSNSTGTGFGLTLRNTGSKFYVSLSTPPYNGGGRTYSKIHSENGFGTNEWHHVGFVYDGSSIKLYLDGIPQIIYIDNTSTNSQRLEYTAPVGSENPIGLFAWSYSQEGHGYEDYGMKGALNDVRIYNNALTDNEVYQLSKGLIFHIDGTPEQGEPVQSIVTNIPSNAYGFALADIRALNTTQSYRFRANAALNTTGSCWYRAYLYNPGWTDAAVSNIKNKYDSTSFIDFTPNKSDMTRINSYYADWNRSDYGTYKDGGNAKAKQYIISKLAPIDRSGFGHKITASNIRFLSGNEHSTASGFKSILFDNISELSEIRADIGVKEATALTYTTWVKMSDIPATDDRYMIARNAFYITVTSEGKLSTYLYGVTNTSTYDDYITGTTTIPKNEWVFLAVTWDGSSIKGYINGNLEFQRDNMTGVCTYDTPIVIGSESNYNNGRRFFGYISDLKLFATALSQADIQELYNTKTFIDKNGNLYCDSYKKDTDLSIASKTGAVTSDKKLYDPIYLEDGSKWIPICVHNVDKGYFTAGNDFTKFNYEKDGLYTNFDLINKVDRPDTGYEFLVRHRENSQKPFTFYRWWQNKNPFDATWEDVQPSAVINIVSDVTDISTSGGGWGGMYYTFGKGAANSNAVKMCFANHTKGNWFGCGICTSWNGNDIPSYNNTSITNNGGVQIVYIRVRHWNTSLEIYNNGLLNANSLYTGYGFNGRAVMEDPAYTELEYIEGPNNAYIDTEFKARSADFRIYAEFLANDRSKRHLIIGNYNDANNINIEADEDGTYRLWYKNGSRDLHYSYYNMNANYQNTKLKSYVDFTQYGSSIAFRTGYFNDNQSVVNSGDVSYVESKYSSTGTFWMFNDKRSDSYSTFTDPLRIYYCKIEKYTNKSGGKWKTEREFIPAIRNSDGMVGLYDKAHCKFYGASGRGYFKPGPKVMKNYLI